MRTQNERKLTARHASSSGRTNHHASHEVICLKIVLNEINPPVWRRVLVTADTPLSDLHLIIQSTMGWMNEASHYFIKDSAKLSPRGAHRHPRSGTHLSYRESHVSDIFSSPGDTVIYTYSSGDGWSHRLIYEESVSHDEPAEYPKCIGGARACPPENCNSIIGYLYLLEALGNPFHPEHEYILNRFGAYDPDTFSKTDINERYREDNYGCY